MSVFLNLSGKSFAISNNEELENQITTLLGRLNVNDQHISFQCGGKPLSVLKNIENNSTIFVSIHLLGGKGGYGAKLKNQGGKKVRPNDNRFSRDAQGRRIQYQMAQKEYAQFVKKKMEEDEQVNQERQQFRVMQQTMKEGNSFMKLDKRYNQEVEETENKITESIKIGRQRLLQKIKLTQIKQQLLLNQETQSSEEKKQRCSNNQNDEDQEKRQILNIQKPIKKIKTDQPFIQQKKIDKPILISAKDKLKSLFKK